MKLKLDENLGHRCVAQLEAAGHDVATVAGQGIAGAADTVVLGRCHEEQGVLVTLDLNFANPLQFRPRLHSGIAVLRLPSEPTPQDLFDAVETLVAALNSRAIDGKLWIVERARIREYQPEDDENDLG